MFLPRNLVLILSLASAQTAFSDPLMSYFDCKDLGSSRFKPYFMQAIESGTRFKDWSQTPKGLLGQGAMSGAEECNQAVAAGNSEYGVICSRTGLGGWKPTIYTGTSPGRADFGYLGGSSIMSLDDCLLATQNSSSKGVCFWGGSDWYVSPIDREGLIKGPFESVEECIGETR
jgi:hypothetical protein